MRVTFGVRDQMLLHSGHRSWLGRWVSTSVSDSVSGVYSRREPFDNSNTSPVPKVRNNVFVGMSRSLGRWSPNYIHLMTWYP